MVVLYTITTNRWGQVYVNSLFRRHAEFTDWAEGLTWSVSKYMRDAFSFLLLRVPLII